MPRRFRLPDNPTWVVFGAGASAALPAELDTLGATSTLVISTPGRRAPALELKKSLGERNVEVLAIAEEHVSLEIAEGARRLAREKGADTLIVLGGGSAIGLAKAIALEHPARIVALPTTYSGSEMTPIWGVTEARVKRTGRDDRVRATSVLYDVRLSSSLPLFVAVSSAFNALAHAVEALYAPNASSTTLILAELAARTLAQGLDELAQHDSEAARERLLYGACLAGACLGAAAMGLHHKLCHVLGGSFGLPHASTHAVLLPYVAELNLKAAPDARLRLGRALGARDPALALFALAERVGAPRDLKSLGLSREAIVDAAALAMRDRYPNPRTIERYELVELLERAWAGAPAFSPAATMEREANTMSEELSYLSGFASPLESEALPGALPRDQNSPQKCAYGLYAELVSGTPFTVRRASNRRVWLYKIRPSLVESEALKLPHELVDYDFDEATPNKLRFRPLPIPNADRQIDFVDGLVTIGGYGRPGDVGYAVHLYAANASMKDRCFSNSDGDLLVLPQTGALECRSELGKLRVAPGELLLLPRGLKFTVALPDGLGRGYVLETFGRSLELPERGLIGSNGLADARHFLAPVADFENRPCAYQVLSKLDGVIYAAAQDHSPFDVVAWHGNHAPYKYDLKLFNAMGTVTFDHPDPSILTVLTCPYDERGRSLADFVIFPPRWEVAEHTFRPPFHHRNAASEINGVLRNGPSPDGFEPGCLFVTPLLCPHGVSTRGYEAAREQPDAPRRTSDDSLWFMFESCLPFRLTRWALRTPLVDGEFAKLFSGVKAHFDATTR